MTDKKINERERTNQNSLIGDWLLAPGDHSSNPGEGEQNSLLFLSCDHTILLQNVLSIIQTVNEHVSVEG